MPADAKPRWITLHKAPYDFYHSRGAVSCIRETGEHLVPAAMADDAVNRGYATEGKAKGSTTRSTKGKSPRKRKGAKAKADAAANPGSNASLAGTNLATDDRAPVRRAVDAAAK